MLSVSTHRLTLVTIFTIKQQYSALFIRNMAITRAHFVLGINDDSLVPGNLNRNSTRTESRNTWTIALNTIYTTWLEFCKQRALRMHKQGCDFTQGSFQYIGDEKEKNPKGISAIPLSEHANKVSAGCNACRQMSLCLVYTCVFVVLQVAFGSHDSDHNTPLPECPIHGFSSLLACSRGSNEFNPKLKKN